MDHLQTAVLWINVSDQEECRIHPEEVTLLHLTDCADLTVRGRLIHSVDAKTVKPQSCV